MIFIVDDLWGFFTGPFTDFFEARLGEGGGNVFYLIPILVLTMGLWFKNPEKPMLPIVFFTGATAIMSSGNIFYHAYGAAVICIVLCALGFTALIMNVVFHQGGT